jgi:hypothetical protein
VYDRICQFNVQHGERWEPAPLLKQLALQGRRFSDLGQGQSVAA